MSRTTLDKKSTTAVRQAHNVDELGDGKEEFDDGGIYDGGICCIGVEKRREQVAKGGGARGSTGSSWQFQRMSHVPLDVVMARPPKQ